VRSRATRYTTTLVLWVFTAGLHSELELEVEG
jgi:hypothetical protein